MKNLFKLFTACLFLSAGFAIDANASHFAGGNFSYTCVGLDSFQITLTLNRDCAGANAPNSVFVNFSSTCGGSTTASLTQVPGQSNVNVSQLCNPNLSTCAGGNQQGMQQFVYSGIVVLTPRCNFWTMSWTSCCRNGAVGNIQSPSGQSMTISATLNNSTTAGVPCNNSPVFTNFYQQPYVCAGQQQQINLGVFDPDGDSLAFSFANPQPATINWSNGFSATAPFGPNVPVTLDPQTGQLTFTPNAAGVYTAVLQVCEYRNGVQIGCITRDFQITVQSTCSNTLPTLQTPGITNFQGNGVQIDSNSVEVCVGNNFSFDIIFTDSLTAFQQALNPPQGDSITITTNATSLLPGALVTIQNGNPASMSISWSAVPGTGTFNSFAVTLVDDACPVPGINTYQFDVTVVPATYAGVDQTICSLQDTAFVNVVGGSQFAWRSLSGDSIIPNVNFSDTVNTTAQNVWMRPSQTTFYEVTSNLLGLCKNIDTIMIEVLQIDAGPDTMLCMGDTLVPTPTLLPPCGGGTPFYQWSPTTGIDPATVNTPTPTIVMPDPSVLGSNQITYTLTYNDGCGCLLQDSFTVDISTITSPMISWVKNNCGINDGELTINPVGGYSPYQFSIDTGVTFVATNVFDSLDIGYYYTQVMDSLGCLSPIMLDTILDPNAPVIDSLRIRDVSCFGANDGEIEVFASAGTAPYTYSNDSMQTYQTSSTFLNLDSALYYVAVQDVGGCRSLPMEALVGTNAQLFLDSVQTVDLSCFEDQTGYIEIFGSGGTDPLEYSIDNGVTYHLSPQFDSLDAGNYVIIIRDSVGCETTPQIITLTQPAQIDINLAIQHDSCFQACGGLAQATVAGGVFPYTFSWNGFGANSLTSNNLCAGSYLFSVVDNNGCTADSAFVIEQPDELLIDSMNVTNLSCNGNNDGIIDLYVSGGTQPYAYSINGGTSFQSSGLFTGLAAGLYNIVVQDSAGRCVTYGTASLIEPSQVNLTTDFSQRTICVSNCVNLSANASGGSGAPYTFEWSVGNNTTSVQSVCPDKDSVYTVYARDVNGCVSNVGLFTINLYDSLEVFAGEDAIICPGESTTLGAFATGGDGGGFRYEWTPAATLEDAFVSSTNATPANTTQYIVKVTDFCGSPAAFDSMNVIIEPLPVVDFTVTDSVAGCAPFDVNLVNTTTPVQFASWAIGDNITASGFSVNVTDLQPGQYDVTLRIRTPAGCEAELTKPSFINVLQNPQAGFDMTPDPTTVFSTQVQFADQSSQDVTQWSWDFAGLGTSQETNPSFQFPSDTGSYPVYLQVTNSNGCIDDTLGYLEIESEFNIYIPNSFTPNGDGINDVFAPVGIGIDLNNYSMQIFNRWGELVFETESLATPWDGRMRGSSDVVPNGSYIWKIYVSDPSNPGQKELTGFINVIR